MSWTSLADASPYPAFDRDTYYRRTGTLLVSDGAQVSTAYMEVSEWNDEPEVRWREPGRDYYSLTFEPTHWQPLPSPPTKD